MLDLIKYSSLSLRKPEGQCIPRGPEFERAKMEKVQLPQCSVEFRAPRHAPLRRYPTEQYRLRTHYDLEHLSSFGSAFVPSDSWRRVRVCSRAWEFYGPWFTGSKGTVYFSMYALGTKEPNPEVNFLYPAAVEAAVQGFVTAYFGHKVYDQQKLIPYYKSPLNWQPITDLPVPAVQLDVDEVLRGIPHCRFVFFPVSKDRLMVFYFAYVQSCAGKREAVDAKISPKPMLDLIDSIISSIGVTPKPELQTEIDKARAACAEGYSVSPECKPFKWPADVDRDGLSILEYREGRYQD